METLHLVRSPANAQRLLEAMDDADAGRVIKRDL
jgi:PHD/YefM family antitoxin component YafN of YafNO toxin-antitoxin module